MTVDRTADGGEATTLAFGASVIRAGALEASPFTVSGLDDDATAALSFSDGVDSVTVSASSNGDGQVDLSSLADGPISSVLVITDEAGNTVTRSGGTTEIDRSPASVLFSGETGLFLNAEALADGLSLAGRASNVDSGVSVTVTLGPLTRTATLGDDGTWSVDLPASDLSGLEAGETTLTVSVPDGAGGAVSATRTVTVDGTAPVVNLTTVLGAQDSVAFADALEGGTLSLKGTVSPDAASLTVTVGSSAVAAVIGASGAFAVAIPRSAFLEGANSVTFSAVDAAGNQASGALGTLTLDRLSDLNALASADAAAEGFLAALGEATGLAESTLAGLDAQGQSTVLGALISNRPSGGYGSLASLEAVLNPVAAYGAQFTALRALRSGTEADLDLAAFGAAVDGAVGLTLGGEVLTQADADGLDAGLARLARLEAEDPQGYAALLPLAATLALGDVTEASLAAALERLESGLAGNTLVFNAYDLTPTRVGEFEATLARLSDGAVNVLSARLSETDLTRFAEPLSKLQDALLRGILEDVKTVELPGDTAALAEPFRLITQRFITDLILNNPEANRAVTAADFRDGGRIDVLRSGLVIAENDPDISLDFGISIGALKVESAALRLLIEVFAAYGDPNDELTVTPGQAALVASVTGQLEFDLNDATLAELNGAGSKAALAVALARLEAVSLLADPGLGTVAFESDGARQSAADALFEARLAAGGAFESFSAAADAFAAVVESTGAASASAVSLGESTSGDTEGFPRDSEAPAQIERSGTSGDDILVGTGGSDRFLPGAGDDHLELGGGVDTVVLAQGGEGQGTDTLYGFLFGSEAEGGDVLSVPGAVGGIAVLSEPVANLSADGLTTALAALQGDLAESSVTYVLAEEGAPSDGVSDVGLARVEVASGEVSAELLLRFVDAGPSFDALEPHNLPDFSGL